PHSRTSMLQTTRSYGALKAKTPQLRLACVIKCPIFRRLVSDYLSDGPVGSHEPHRTDQIHQLGMPDMLYNVQYFVGVYPAALQERSRRDLMFVAQPYPQRPTPSRRDGMLGPCDER